VGQEPDHRSLLQFAFQFGDQSKGLHAGVVQVEDDQGGLLFAVEFEAVAEIGFALDEFQFHIQLAGGFLNLGLEEKIVHEGEDSGGGIFAHGQRLGFGLGIGMGKAGALASGAGTVVAARHGSAVAVIHGRAINAALLLIAAGWVAAAASGTTTTPSSVSPSTTAGGASGSCIHIFSL